jgi:two-component system cell cycle sensor histidine kinase/response regulator CckA
VTDAGKTREQLLDELERERRRVAALEDTERGRATEALRQSEEKYRAVFDQSVEGIYLHDLDGRILDVNQMACVQTGYSRGELMQLGIFALHPENPSLPALSKSEILCQWRQWQPDQRFTLEVEHRRKDGTVFPVEISTGVIRYGGGNVILAIVQDITQRRQTEAEKAKLQEMLQQTQKLEAIGTLAGGVAHDMNNILAGIMMSAEFLGLEVSRAGSPPEEVAEILRLCRRGREMTQQLLLFARKQQQRKTQVAVPKLIREVAETIRRLADKKVSLELDVEDRVGAVEGDADQLYSVVMNLCVNALDAMSDGGTLTVTCKQRLLAEGEADAHLGLPDGAYVCVQVTDTGVGMDPSTVQRATEPFFTTKGPGAGTGLGLAMAYGAVKTHGGMLTIDSVVGEGTTVTVHLPEQSDRSESTHPVPLARAGRHRGSGAALLVDDEATIRGAGKKLLERLGYEVLLAADGREALEICRQRRGELSVVVLDLVMPEMDGEECFHELRAEYPDVKVLLVSGHGKESLAEELLRAGACGFLRKPFDSTELENALAEALDD